MKGPPEKTTRSLLRSLRALLVSVPALFMSLTTPGQVGPGDMASTLEEARTFTKYPTYEQYLDMMAGFAAAHPEICTMDTIGTSVQGRLVLAVKISDNPQQEEPEARFLYTSTMHGNELVGYPLMLRLIDTLLTGYGSDPHLTALVDSLEIWINPLANPDGTYAGGNLTVAGSVRDNAVGVDLNRDFPDIEAGEADDETGRQKETADMMRFLRNKRFSLSANIHSGFEVVNYPWDYDSVFHPDDLWFRLISREYADEAHETDPEYLTVFDNGITHGAYWYEVAGSRQDYVTWYLGGREVTLELSFEKRLPADSLESFWQKNHRSLLYFMTQATYGVRGKVSDAVSGAPVSARVTVLGHDKGHSVVHASGQHGAFYRLIHAGTYELAFSAAGYVGDTVRNVSVANYDQSWLSVELQPLIPGRVDGHLAVNGIRAYPNPFTDHLTLVTDNRLEGQCTISLYSATGRLVHRETRELPVYRGHISPGRLLPGWYLLEIRNGNRVYRIPVIRK